MQLSLLILIITFVLLIYQSIKAEDTLNQVLSLELMGVASIGLFLILYIVQKKSLFLDLAQLLTFLSFVIALVFSTFLPKKEEKE
jgi:multisubunit Na+/H+ antiporter MnhF subunit